jgi:ABC-type multidrug transport system permease subunit
LGTDALGRPDSYRPTQATGEGVWLIAFGILLAFVASGNWLMETTSRSLQLLPLLVGLASAAMWISAERYSREIIAEWIDSGGSGEQTLMPWVCAAAIAAIGVAFAWLELKRPAYVRQRTQGLVTEWGLTRWSAVGILVAGGLAILGAIVALLVTIAIFGSVGVIVAVVLSGFGLLLGLNTGLFIARRLEARSAKD